MSGSGFRRAVQDVQRELRHLGLGHLVERVAIDRSWSVFSHATGAIGLYYLGDRRRRTIGRIRIPAITLPLLNIIISGLQRLGFRSRSRISLRFVLRHEYAHALAHVLGRFDHPGPPWGHGSSFTTYAATDPDEDLAETVAIFLTHHGRRPRRRMDYHLSAKWNAAATLLRNARFSSRRLGLHHHTNTKGNAHADLLYSPSRR